MKKLFLLLAIVIAPAVAHAQENPEAARASGEAALIEIVLPTAELSPTMKLKG